ncbi:MAG: hypothetical protein IPP56_13075 [Bacteroidetes bacterium]|nr:hypothetical protein [Bacteroidota bacterium]MBK9800595.1 hypothetical protein [Bacteroidota bacterium]MBP6411957.1 hypothetical protein [Bacteroidia bacterium]
MIVAIGYLASAFLAYSLIVSNALRFRWLNIAGCLLFITYGFLIDAFPVMLANSILFFINLYQLLVLLKSKETFELLPFESEGILVQRFVEFYASDIELFFPGFKFSKEENKLSFVVLRDLVIANVFVATIDEQGEAKVKLNYTVKHYRDYKVGRFIFEREKEFLRSKGIKKIVYEGMQNKQHLRFLKVMGFEECTQNGLSRFCKTLN